MLCERLWSRMHCFLDELDCRVHFKCENLQHVGAFKARGATNAVLSLSEEIAGRGVVTHSSGNHAAALARAATIRRIPAHIVMPHNSLENKTCRGAGLWSLARVLSNRMPTRARSAADEIEKKTGATLIHPYNDAAVIAGQGTVGLEILEQSAEIDTVVVPVGGGGLLSGILIAVKSLRPEIKVIAAEPAWADDAARSLRSGRIEMPTRYDTIADGLRTPLGDLTFPVIQALLDDILLVDEQTIERRRDSSQQRPSSSPNRQAPSRLAALLQHRSHFRGRNTVAVISGGQSRSLDLNRCGSRT